jgi:hypothetical protein
MLDVSGCNRAASDAPRRITDEMTSGESVIVFVLGISLTLGLLLTGIATIRAGVHPRWAGILLLGATVGFFFVFFIAEFLPPQAGQIGSALLGIILGMSLAWIGLSMCARAKIAIQKEIRVSEAL